MPTCRVRGCKLVRAITPIRYGYPDNEALELGMHNPHHGKYDLGECGGHDANRPSPEPTTGFLASNSRTCSTLCEAER